MIIIAFSAFLASGLTLFSGFGLGTLLMPVIALFFPVDAAIGMTALVHLANNVFKIALLGLKADREVVIRFGLPGTIASFAGAGLLVWLGSLHSVATYSLMGRTFEVVPIQMIVGIMIIVFVIMEISPWFSSITFDRNLLPVGGMVSGFFGGLSGNQGAFRSMFLLKAGLSKEQFIATGVVLAVMIDVSRLAVYGWDTLASHRGIDWLMVLVATISAFVGATIGIRLIHKVTIRSIQIIVSGFLIVVALGLILGII